jgi:hypothetical protein
MPWIYRAVRAILISWGYGAILAGLLGENAGLPFDPPILTRDARHSNRRSPLPTFATGYVDIVGLLTVYRMFTAHMTGTTVHLREQIIQRNWKAAMIAAPIVAAFFWARSPGEC